MAGSWPLARTVNIGSDGRPVVGLRAYFYEAGTTTPLDIFTDYGLGTPSANPVETDSYGRFPPVFMDEAESFYRVRVQTATGTVIYDDDIQPIIGPGEGEGGAEVPVDANALFDTGDIKASYDTGVKAGWVRGNGRTIGSAVSGAAERANADTQFLFEHLWTKDSTLTVSGGRGASATADFEANKTITLPDFRGRIMAALDDMGASAAGVLTGLTTLGEVMGREDYTLVSGNIPELTTSSNGAHTHSFDFVPANDPRGQGTGEDGIADGTTTTTSSGAHTHTVGNSSPTAFSLVPPIVGVTVYIKL